MLAATRFPPALHPRGLLAGARRNDVTFATATTGLAPAGSAGMAADKERVGQENKLDVVFFSAAATGLAPAGSAGLCEA